MGQSMRRAMIALGLAEPDASSDSKAEAPSSAQHSTDVEQHVGQGDQYYQQQDTGARNTDGQQTVEHFGRSSDFQGSEPSEQEVGESEHNVHQGHASRLRVSRHAAEYRAPVTPIKRSPFTSREIADDMRTITTVHPRSYNDAKSVGESFRDGTPVIMDLTDLGEAEAKRLVDFAAGLVYALHGSIERVTTTVFLLTPSYVEVVDNTVAAADEIAVDQG